MITPAQLRAARGMLDWTRSKLAKASGLSAETIKNIEHGIYTPQEATIEAIIRTFAEQDLEFTENEGIRRNTNIVVTYEGQEDFKKYADDIYELLLDHPEDRTISIFGNSDEDFIRALGDYAKVHLTRMSTLDGLSFKALVLEGAETLVSEYIEYKQLPNMAFAIPFSVYANRFDFIIYGEGKSFPKVVAIKSQLVADVYRAQFKTLWETSKPISKKISKR